MLCLQTKKENAQYLDSARQYLNEVPEPYKTLLLGPLLMLDPSNQIYIMYLNHLSKKYIKMIKFDVKLILKKKKKMSKYIFNFNIYKQRR